MQTSMSARDRRALVGGGLAISLLFVLARGLPAAAGWQRDRMANAVRASQLLAASSVDPGRLREARDSLSARRARLTTIDSTLPSATSASAAVAALASTLEDLADSSSVRVAAIQLRSDSVASAGILEVSVRVNGIGDVTGLAGFLRSIAGARTPLAVRDLTITSPEPTAPGTKSEALRFDILVVGLARAEGTRR